MKETTTTEPVNINPPVNTNELEVISWSQVQSRPFMVPLKGEMLNEGGYLITSGEIKIRFKPHLPKARYLVKYDKYYVVSYLAYHLQPLIDKDVATLHKMIDDIAINSPF